MSTRATYQFVSSLGDTDAATKTFYLHYDGYPEGAAKYFSSALKCQSNDIPCGYQLHYDFILNHNPSEIEDHAEHGDTEFRYTFNRDTLNILVEKRVGSLPWGFDNYFDGTLMDFIEQETDTYYESTDYRDLMMSMVDDGVLSAEDALRACLVSMTQDDVRDTMILNELKAF
jgi:hypothetical protein